MTDAATARPQDEDVMVVGGGNSAGQAAVHLASRARSVRVVVRGKALKSTMSHYLVERIEVGDGALAVRFAHDVLAE